MKEEGGGTAIKSNKERGKQPQGGASRVPDSTTVYHREKTPRNNSNEAKQKQNLHT